MLILKPNIFKCCSIQYFCLFQPVGIFTSAISNRLQKLKKITETNLKMQKMNTVAVEDYVEILNSSIIWPIYSPP